MTQYAYTKVVRKYYKSTDVYNYFKYQYQAWTQPTLTANGTLGGNSCACYASSAYDAFVAWKAFDNKTNTSAAASSTGSSKGYYIIFYTPTPINVSKLTFRNRYDVREDTFTNYTVYGSNDNVTYTSLGTFSNSVTANSATYSCNISTINTYKYFKVVVNAYKNWSTVAEISITAQAMTIGAGTPTDYDYKEYVRTDISESTSSDYDYYEDKLTQYATNLNNTQYGVTL